jgi:beta-mannanase
VDNGEATFNYSASESGSSFECSLDDVAFAPCTSPKSYTGLGNGQHTFRVRARDAAGNEDATPAARTWTVALLAPPSPPSGPLEKFEPADGEVYDGVDANQQAGDTVTISTQKWADYSANILGGEKPLISHTFTSYDTNMTFDMDIAKARGAVPLVSWQTGSTSPKTIANAGAASSGARSDYVIMKVAASLRTYNQPVFLRIDQEMNAHWFAWGAYNSDGSARTHSNEDFKDMWRRMHIVFEGGTVATMNQKLAAEGMPPLDLAVGTSAASKGLSSTTDPNAYLAPTPNVAFVFNPVDAPGIPNVAGNRWADYYPGDEYVDWVGQTSYDSTWNATLDTRFSWLDQFYQAFAIGHDKPYMMGEWGLEQYRGDDPAYIQRVLDWQKAHPQVKALVYFNVRTSTLEHRLEVYPNSGAVMRADAPRYLNSLSTP